MCGRRESGKTGFGGCLKLRVARAEGGVAERISMGVHRMSSTCTRSFDQPILGTNSSTTVSTDELQEPFMGNYVRILRWSPGVLVGIVAVTMTAQALAADADSGDKLEEVVVTAQKREQNLQDVGTSITAFTSADL